MGIGYRKSQKREHRNFIHIYSNGETEINYFNAKKKQLKKRNIKIEHFLENAGNPAQFVKIISKRYHIRDITEKDKIFCVMDIDEITNENILKAMRIKENYIHLIFSNPNFELWLLLHFKLYTHQFSIDETLVKLKDILPEYEKPHIDPIFPLLQRNESNAITNAHKIRQLHERACVDLNSCEANPHTRVDALVLLLNSLE